MVGLLTNIYDSNPSPGDPGSIVSADHNSGKTGCSTAKDVFILAHNNSTNNRKKPHIYICSICIKIYLYFLHKYNYTFSSNKLSFSSVDSFFSSSIVSIFITSFSSDFDSSTILSGSTSLYCILRVK